MGKLIVSTCGKGLSTLPILTNLSEMYVRNTYKTMFYMIAFVFLYFMKMPNTEGFIVIQ